MQNPSLWSEANGLWLAFSLYFSIRYRYVYVKRDGGYEYFSLEKVCLLFGMLLGASLDSPRPLLWFGAACAMAIPVFFIKFSTALGLVSALALFTAALLLTDARRARYYLVSLAVLHTVPGTNAGRVSCR